MKKKIKPYILPYSLAIAIPLSVGLVSALLTKDSMKIYAEIITPPLAPPAWLFPIVWTALYALMGIGSCMIYLKRESAPSIVRTGLTYYAMSLVANFGWSIIFFNMRLFGIAFLWLLLLLYLILRTVASYFKVAKIASYLQIPYIAWVIFAGYLNLAIYILN